MYWVDWGSAKEYLLILAQKPLCTKLILSDPVFQELADPIMMLISQILNLKAFSFFQLGKSSLISWIGAKMAEIWAFYLLRH